MLLVLIVVLSLAGCQGKAQDAAQTQNMETESSTQAAEAVQVESADAVENAEKKMTPWINSNVAGTVTEDTKAELKDDFSLAVNFDYLKDTQIGEGKMCEDSFSEVADITKERLLKMFSDDSIEGDDAQLLRELYAMWLDWDTRNSLGVSELVPYIEAIEQINTLDDLNEYMCSDIGRIIGAGLSSEYIAADMEDSRWYCVEIGSTSLSLGDSDEYEQLTSVGERDLQVHRETAALMLERFGYEEGEIDAILEKEYSFEKKIASAILSTAELYEMDSLERMINKVTVSELAELSPNYPIVKILEAEGLAGSERINLEEPEWLSRLNELYTEENLEEMKSYILVQTLVGYCECFDEETYRRSEEIANEAYGVTGSLSDEKQALEKIVTLLPTIVSRAYVGEYVGEEVREDVTNIIEECIDAYRTMLASEDWLSEETKKNALEKLDNMTIHAAYPDKWKNTDRLKITTGENGGSYFKAVTEIQRYAYEMDLKKVNEKVDREAWADDMLLTDANAYYNMTDNSINIIAGILGGVFYDSDMTEEEKLAGIGLVIGHEISHAFDTMGAQFDKDGNFANWWTEEDHAAFEARAQKLVDYYNTIVPFDDGENYPGSNVKTEAIADMAGMKCMLLIAQEKEAFDYDTFFRTYAEVWKCVITREYSEYNIYQDPHPAEYLRINITLMQMPEFYETYGIKEGNGMYMAEEDRISVW